MVTAPGMLAVQRASASRASSDTPTSHHSGAPAPIVSASSASAISGIETKVVSGMAMTLASAPYNPAW